MLEGTSTRHSLQSKKVWSSWLPSGLHCTNPPPAVLSEYLDEEAMDSRLLHREHILLTRPPPTFGESPELE
jgi:hypothetical protein